MRSLYRRPVSYQANGVLRGATTWSHSQAANVLHGLRLASPPLAVADTVTVGDLDVEDVASWHPKAATVWAATTHRPDGTFTGVVLLADPVAARPGFDSPDLTVVPVARGRGTVELPVGLELYVDGQPVAPLPGGPLTAHPVATLTLDSTAGPVSWWLCPPGQTPPLPARDDVSGTLDVDLREDEPQLASDATAILVALGAAPDDEAAWRHAGRLPFGDHADGYGGNPWDLPPAMPGATWPEVDGAWRLVDLVCARWAWFAEYIDQLTHDAGSRELSRMLAVESELDLACAPYRAVHGRDPDHFADLARFIDRLTDPDRALDSVGHIAASEFLLPGCWWMLASLIDESDVSTHPGELREATVAQLAGLHLH